MKEYLYVLLFIMICTLSACGVDHHEIKHATELYIKQTKYYNDTFDTSNLTWIKRAESWIFGNHDSLFSHGYVGLWTKEDSVTAFDNFEVMGHGGD